MEANLQNNNYQIFKNLMSEESRLTILNMLETFPEICWSGSLCTDEPLNQLRDYIPFKLAKELYKVHDQIFPTLKDYCIKNNFNFGLNEINYLNAFDGTRLTVDKRTVGMKLDVHQDVPTGTYTKEYGITSGKDSALFSAIFYWNDNFDGGEISLYDSKYEDIFKAKGVTEETIPYFTYQPVAGDTLVFRSDIYHAIMPVTEGVRYSSQYFFTRN